MSKMLFGTTGGYCDKKNTLPFGTIQYSLLWKIVTTCVRLIPSFLLFLTWLYLLVKVRDTVRHLWH